MAETSELLKYIISQAKDRGVSLTKTALVKLLYLADIESTRRGVSRLSSVNWIYYKFGPYAFELETAIREIAGRDIEEFEGISPRGHKYFTYQPTESIETAALTPEEKALVSSVVERWAGEAIESLLNYAYFDTEPMQDAVWGEPLDFSLVSKRVAPISLQEIVLMTGGKAAIERLQRLRSTFWESASKRKSARVTPKPDPRFDSVFFDGIAISNEPEFRPSGLTGKQASRETET